MAIVDGLITLEEARKSLGWEASNTANDSDLERYVEAATPVIENITGPLLVRSVTYKFDGGFRAVVLPDRFTSVTAVVESGVTVTDYVAEPDAGIIAAGTATSPREFEAGHQNVVVTVSVGAATVPAHVKLATRELVRHWWQQGRQGNRPGFGNDVPIEGGTPMGFAVPKRVRELLEPSPRLAGFA